MKIDLRKTIQFLCYYLIPLFLLISTYVNIYFGNNIYEMMVELGEIAFNLILVSLFIKPLTVLLPKFTFLRKIMSYRREMGVLAFWYAMFHSIYLAFYLGLFSNPQWSLLLEPTNFVAHGIFAAILMFLLGITSNKLAVIKLKQNWKKFQRIAYLLLVFAVFHKAFGSGELEVTLILLVFIILKVAEYWKIKQPRNVTTNQ